MSKPASTTTMGPCCSTPSDHEPTSSGSRKGPLKLIISGAPASGKGSQCEVIQKTYGVVHLSTGDMLRSAVAAKTTIGMKAQKYMDAGNLVPDEIIINIVKDRLAQEDCAKQGWLLDGFPRTAAQAEAMLQAGIKADCFIFLNVDDEALIQRVIGRRTDPETGKIYHLTFDPPPSEIIDRLQQRSDDTEEKVKVRLQQFHSNIDAVKDHFTGILETVDSNHDKETVSKAVIAAIDGKVGL